MKKILLVSVKSDSPAGGIAVWTDYFLRHCAEHDMECHLVNTEIIGKRNKTGKRHFVDEMVRTFRIIINIQKALRQNAFDLAYLNTSCGTFGLFRDAFIARLVHNKKIPLVTQYHCDIPFWVKSKISMYGLGKLVESSTQNLVLCENSKQFLLKHYYVEASKIPNFIDSEFLRTNERNFEGPVKEVVYVGLIVEHKGAAELFSVARKLPHIHFTFIGNINGNVPNWDVPINVSLPGHINHQDIIPHLDKADVFLFPSHTEGCSLALMEAMARGVPAIATNTGANMEMLTPECGIIVPLHDVNEMILALQKLDDSVLRKSLSKNAVHQIRHKYTDKNVDKLFHIL